MKTKTIKTYFGEIKEISDEEKIVEHYLTVEKVDRDKEIVSVEGIDYSHYMKNPVVLWAHGKDPIRGGLPIGKNLSISAVEINGVRGLKARTQFFDDDFSQKLFEMVKRGFLNAWSISFIGEKQEKNGIGVYEKIELLEYSLVPVPANRDALTLAVNKGIISHEEADRFNFMIRYKRVIPYKRTPLAPPDIPWDGPREMREADIEDLKIICTWYDEERPDIKSSYKLPHHRARDHYCVWAGVRAAMAALFGARGGVDIPSTDWDGCYEHLAKHYRDFEKEPPQPKIYWINLEISNFLSKIRSEKVEQLLAQRGTEKDLEEALSALQKIQNELNEILKISLNGEKISHKGVDFLNKLYEAIERR